ncbi:hypothetical protein HanRHA438_Chr03g0132621 [Helianthus annuus]|nr:hypothetical protein HanRHA438_Chr03g0132621 [Helianthus annuus]
MTHLFQRLDCNGGASVSYNRLLAAGSPPPPPHPPSASCQDDLGGVGSLDTTCKGNFYILPNVTVNCSFVVGCEFGVNVSGNFSLGENAQIVVGSFELVAMNAVFAEGSVVNTTGLAGDPPGAD